MHAPGALLAALASHDAEALAPHLADTQQGPLLHGMAACAEAAWAVEPAAAAVSLAAAADRVHRLYPHRRTLKALVPLLGEAAFRQLMDPLGCCALSLAAALGHTATLEAMLDAGADPNPLEPSGRPMWHPLAAAAMAHDAGNVDSCGEPRVSEATAVQMCELLLSRGADVAACLAAYGPACQSRRASWLLKLHSRAVQRLLLRELLLTVQQGCLRPNFELGSVLLLLAAQADEAGAFLSLAAALPAGRLPAEYRQLAQDAVATARCCLGGGAACGSDSGSAAESNGADGRPGEVLRCMVQLAATAQQQAAAGVSAGAAVPAHFAEQLGLELSACLHAAALDGHTGQLAALLEAGVPVTAAAVVCAVRGGSLPCLQLLLRYGIPPAEPLPADLVLRLPSSMESGLQYPCPVLTLLATHAAQVGRRGRVAWVLMLCWLHNVQLCLFGCFMYAQTHHSAPPHCMLALPTTMPFPPPTILAGTRPSGPHQPRHGRGAGCGWLSPFHLPSCAGPAPRRGAGTADGCF